MKFIEKHNKLLAVALCACTVGTAAQSVHAFETKPGWHGQGKDRYYIQASNRKEATGLTEVQMVQLLLERLLSQVLYIISKKVENCIKVGLTMESIMTIMVSRRLTTG